MSLTIDERRNLTTALTKSIEQYLKGALLGRHIHGILEGAKVMREGNELFVITQQPRRFAGQVFKIKISYQQ